MKLCLAFTHVNIRLKRENIAISKRIDINFIREQRAAKLFVVSTSNTIFITSMPGMKTQSDDYYLKYPEPFQGCLLALKYIIMHVDENITHELSYQIPLFCYKGKKLAILWITGKKFLLGYVTDKSVLPIINGKKPRNQYEMIEIDPNADLPKEMIEARLLQKIRLYEDFNK